MAELESVVPPVEDELAPVFAPPPPPPLPPLPPPPLSGCAKLPPPPRLELTRRCGVEFCWELVGLQMHTHCPVPPWGAK